MTRPPQTLPKRLPKVFELAGVNADRPGVVDVPRTLSVRQDGHATHFLHLGEHMIEDCGLANVREWWFVPPAHAFTLFGSRTRHAG